MATEEILQDISNGRFQGLDQHVLNYLKPALEGGYAAGDPAYSYRAAQFLKAYILQIDRIPECHIGGTLEVLRACRICLKLQPCGPPEAVTTEKLLYRLVVKLLEKELVDDALEFIGYLQECLAGRTDEDSPAKGVAYNAYARLWNASQNDKLEPAQGLRLQLRALKLHTLFEKEPTNAKDRRLMYLLSKFEAALALCESDTEKQNLLNETNRSVQEIIDQIVKCYQNDKESIGFFMLTHVEFKIWLLRLFIKQNNQVLTNFANDFIIDRHVDRLESVTFEIVTLSCLMCQTAVLAVALTQRFSSNGLETKSSLADILDKMDKCNNQLSQCLHMSPSNLYALKVLSNCCSFVVEWLQNIKKQQKNVQSLKKNASGNKDSDMALDSRISTLYELGHQLYQREVTLLEKQLADAADTDMKRLQEARKKEVVFKSNRLLCLLKEDSNKSPEETLAHIQKSERELKNLVQIIDRYCAEPQAPVAAYEIKDIGTVAQKFGCLCYNTKLYPNAVKFLSIASSQVKKWIRYSKVRLDKEDLSVWKTFETLNDALRKVKKYREAMDAVADGLLLDSKQLATAAVKWVQLKADLLKVEPLDVDIQAVTLWEACEKRLRSLGMKRVPLAIEEVLYTELYACRDARITVHLAHLAVAETLLKHFKKTGAQVDQAYALLQMAQVLWITRKKYHSTPREICVQAVDILEAIEQKSKSSTRDDDLASAYLWLYIIHDVDPAELKNKKQESEDSRPSSPNFKENPENFSDCFTLGMEERCMKPLDDALETWEKVIAENGKQIPCRSLPTTLNLVLLVASIYRLAGKVSREYRAFSLACYLSVLAKQPRGILSAHTGLAQLYCRLKQPLYAERILQETQQRLSDFKTDQIKNELTYLRFILAQAEVCILKNKVGRGYQLLQEAIRLQNANIRHKTKDFHVADSAISRLQARFLCLPPSYWSAGIESDDRPDIANALEVIFHGGRSISSVVCHMLGNWVLKLYSTKDVDTTKELDNTMGKWEVLDELLRTLLESGYLFMRVGDSRQAQCYLQQGLTITQAFHLPRRFVEFHIAFGKLANLSGDFGNTKAHLHVVGYMFTNDLLAESNRNLSGKPDKKQDCFGFDDLNGESDDDAGNTSFTCNKLADISGLSNTSLDDQGADLPESQVRYEIKTPQHWRHDKNCNCSVCYDFILQKNSLEYYQTRSHLVQGDSGDVDKYFNLLLDRHTTTASHLQEGLKTLLQYQSHLFPQTMPKVQKRQGDEMVFRDPEPSMLQDFLVEVYLQRLSCLPKENDRKLYPKWATKCSDLLRCDLHPWMVESILDRVQLQYTVAAWSLRWPTEDKTSAVVDNLCSQISRIRLKDVPEALLKTPAVSKVKSRHKSSQTSRLKAPAKAAVGGRCLKKRIVNDKAFPSSQLFDNGQDDDTIKCLTFAQTPRNEVVISEVPVSENRPISVDKTESISATPCRIGNNSIVSTEATSLLVSGNNTNKPAAKMREKPQALIKKIFSPSINLFKTPIAEDANCNRRIKPPRSVANSRRVMLEALLESDSDDEKPEQESRETQKKKKPQSRPKKEQEVSKKNTSKKGKPVKLEKSQPVNKKSANVLSEVNIENIQPDTPTIIAPSEKSVSKRILKWNSPLKIASTAKKDVYELPDSDYDSPKPTKQKSKRATARSKAASAKPVATAKNKSSTTKRTGKDILNNLGKSVKSSGSTRSTRLLRSVTNVVEDERFDEDSEEISMNLSVDDICLTEDETDPDDTDLVSSDSCLSFVHVGVEKLNDPVTEGHFIRAYSDDIDLPILTSYENASVNNMETAARLSTGKTPVVIDWPATAEGFPPIEIARAGSDDETGQETRLRGRGRAVRKKATAKTLDDEKEVSRKTKIASKKSQVPVALEDNAKPQPTDYSDTQEIPDKRPGPVGEHMSGEIASKAKDRLLECYRLISHFPPAVPYRNVCQALALYCMENNKWEAAFYLAESQSVTFRHSAILNISRKLRRMDQTESESEEFSNQCGQRRQSVATYRATLVKMKQSLAFGKTVDNLKQSISSLPPEWTVCQLSVLTPVGKPVGQMVITCFRNEQEPLVIRLPDFATSKGQQVLHDFDYIIRCNHEVMEVTDRCQWWTQRIEANEKLQALLTYMEDQLLGWWKILLVGSPSEKEGRDRLMQAVDDLVKDLNNSCDITVSRPLLQMLLNGGHSLNEVQLIHAIHVLTGLEDDGEKLLSIMEKIKQCYSGLELATSCRQPLILVLDKVIQHLPWESMPVLRRQAVSRVPSLQFLVCHLSTQLADPNSVFNRAVDMSSVYYVVDPENNLPNTRELIGEHFKNNMQGWSGLVGCSPSSSQYRQGLTEHDLFIYCGHGSGSKFLSGEGLQQVHCRAVSLLMGCSSGRLRVEGQLEAYGLTLNYLLAGCPSVVANLWDVTDKDIDRFLLKLVDSWGKTDSSTNLLRSLAESRDVCRLPYLIGAAPVCYGLPINCKSPATPESL